MNKFLIPLAVSLITSSSQAVVIYLDLIGTAGPGLLPGNEPGAIVGGTGGELASTTGISYDTDTNILDLTNVGWGSSKGFTDLTSVANNSHLHGPTASTNGSGFTQTASAPVSLTRSTDAITGGVFTNPIIDFDTAFGVNAETRETQLLNGQFYINIHTATNGGGEMRGFLVVPEPSTPLLGLLAVGSFFLRRQRA